MRRNGHIFLIRICKRERLTMLYPICACSCTVRYSMQKKDSSTRMTPKQSFLNYADMKDLVFQLWILLMYLEIMWILMIGVVNIDVLRNYLAIEFIDIVNIIFNSSDVVWMLFVKWMCSEFENYTIFVANSNICWICTWLIGIGWLGQPIPIMIFGIGSQQSIPKIPHFRII
jgi:hypothetical protein